MESFFYRLIRTTHIHWSHCLLIIIVSFNSYFFLSQIFFILFWIVYFFVACLFIFFLTFFNIDSWVVSKLEKISFSFLHLNEKIQEFHKLLCPNDGPKKKRKRKRRSRTKKTFYLFIMMMIFCFCCLKCEMKWNSCW